MRFHEALDSDHRAIFCDLDQNLFKKAPDPMIIKTRQIGTNSTNREGEKYIRHINEQFDYHKIYEKVDNIYNSTNNSSETIETRDKVINTLD
jgi:hypothetical protein